jgi:hypothetical protein
MANNSSNDGIFLPSADLQRVSQALEGLLRTSAAWVLHHDGEQSFNHLLKFQARSLSDLARMNGGPDLAREILDEIAAACE